MQNNFKWKGVIMSLIKTSECVKCAHSTIDDTNKAKVIIHCKAKGKEFIYGQYVECNVKRETRNRQ